MRTDLSAARKAAEAELEAVLADAARLADKHEAKYSIVRRVFNASPQLMHRLMKPWALERMLRILRSIEKRAAPENQLTIPGLDLPPIIRLAKPDPESKRSQKPQRLALRAATLPQLIQYRKELLHSLRPSQDHRVREVDKAIALMRQHAPRSRKITLGEVLEKYGQERLDLKAKE